MSKQNTTTTNIKPIKIKNLRELKKLISRIEESSSTTNQSSIVLDSKVEGLADQSYDGKIVIPQSDSQSTLGKTIIDGFKMIKNHFAHFSESNKVLSDSSYEFGGFVPASIPSPNDHQTWLDVFIQNNTGGKRIGLSIVWDLPEGKYKYSPLTSSLEKIDD